MPFQDVDRLDELIEPMLSKARIPGAALAVVVEAETIFARAYGYRDLAARLPMTTDTVYPIASTTKAMNTTLLGMLVDEGRLAWDVPIQRYVPRFALHDPMASAATTLRDLVAMRTGLPRHDLVWIENSISRTDLVQSLSHLPLSVGFRERFQYNNLTPTLAAHVAEIVTGQAWEELVGSRILAPLGMTQTTFAPPAGMPLTCSYHENDRREIVATQLFSTEPIAPAGGSIHSTVHDMTRWIAFNLCHGSTSGRQLIERQTLEEIHSPCVVMGADSAAPSAGAAYALGWFVDTYNGRTRISHTGYLHDVNSCVTLFPAEHLGIVSFTNFASSRITGFINQCVLDLLAGLQPAQTLAEVLQQYEDKILDTRRRNASVRRAEGTSPSHPLSDYTGRYLHPGCGCIEIRREGGTLIFVRGNLQLVLEHWHYDAWVVGANDLFEIHKQHMFERANRIAFETSLDGQIVALSMQLEPTVAPLRFVKEPTSSQSDD